MDVIGLTNTLQRYDYLSTFALLKVTATLLHVTSIQALKIKD